VKEKYFAIAPFDINPDSETYEVHSSVIEYAFSKYKLDVESKGSMQFRNH